MPWPTTNSGERLLASKLDAGRRVFKAVDSDNLQLKGFDGTAHTLKVWNPNTNGLALLVTKNDGTTVLIDARDSGVTIGGPVTIAGDLLQAGGPVFNVVAYGADRTAATASDAAVTAALAAMPSYGGVLYFPAGSYIFNSEIVINKAMAIAGDGALITTIYRTNATNNVFNVTVPQNTYIVFDGMGIGVNGVTATAGAGIVFTPPAGQWTSAPIVRNCWFGFQNIGIDCIRALNARIINNSFTQNVADCVRFDFDISPWGGGDHLIMFNHFTSTTIGSTTGIRMSGSAGFYIGFNKFIGFGTQILLAPLAGRLNLSDLIIANNSMEGQPTTPSLINLAGLEPFENIQILGNQLVANAGTGINVAGVGANNNNILIADNIVEAVGTANAIGFSAGDEIYIHGNKVRLSGAGTTAFVNAGATNIRRGRNYVAGNGTLQSGAWSHIEPMISVKRVTLPNTNAALGALFKGPASAAQSWSPAFMTTPHTVDYRGITEGALQAVVDSLSATQFTAHAVGAANATGYEFDVIALSDG